jgi:hypothetical protein
MHEKHLFDGFLGLSSFVAAKRGLPNGSPKDPREAERRYLVDLLPRVAEVSAVEGFEPSYAIAKLAVPR